ncbi:glycosyltransferase [uncultured Subdoligranulum sp.]|uniref:glycosyltransferase n=1 Tax=uncultured Subdoligranulum sp. TaxID=512298 RepID=UPI0025FA8232|nr:glycosyltransferase [uncultured Subdoligranulum sp.]
MGKFLLKMCVNEWDSASRDKRELAVCRELGMRTLVMARGENEDYGRPDKVDEFDVLRYTTRPLGGKVPVVVNRIISAFQWAYAARKMHPDIISGHDIIALGIAWISTWFQGQNKPSLVYDAHEFELGRYTGGARKQIVTVFIKRAEKFLMKRCAFSIVVNDSIANALQQVHHLEQRPVVVRSTPTLWVRDEDAISRNRRAMLAEMPGVRYLLMFHGNLARARGIPDLIRAASRYSDTGVVLMGMQNDKKFVEELKVLAAECGITARLLFRPPVCQDELVNYAGCADLEFVMTEPVVKNHYFSSPNKFFESIQAEVPVIASDLPEMRRIVDQYHIGLCCKPNDVEELCRCIDKLREDAVFYARCKENLKIAKQDLCWEKEKNVLQQAYRALL